MQRNWHDGDRNSGTVATETVTVVATIVDQTEPPIPGIMSNLSRAIGHAGKIRKMQLTNSVSLFADPIISAPLLFWRSG